MITATRHSVHTDFHNINDDIRTISCFGGGFRNDLNCGMLNRRLERAQSEPNSSFASRLTTKTIHYSIYTDSHDINEDIRTISHFGGYWHSDLPGGIFVRTLFRDPHFSLGGGSVASRSTLEASHYPQYTDFHDIDEDFATIPGHGGCWYDGEICGLLCRFSVDPSFAFYDVGASRLPIRTAHHSN